MTHLNASLCLGALILLGLLLGGCETIEDRVRTTREVPVVTREFNGSADAVMAAAKQAFAVMGYSITSISSAHGTIDAISDIRRDAGMRNFRQTRIRFTVVDRDGGYALATMQAWEIREEENTRGERLMSETGVSSHSFHHMIFGTIEDTLGEQPK
jgi:hypothetical protein